MKLLNFTDQSMSSEAEALQRLDYRLRSEFVPVQSSGSLGAPVEQLRDRVHLLTTTLRDLLPTLGQASPQEHQSVVRVLEASADADSTVDAMPENPWLLKATPPSSGPTASTTPSPRPSTSAPDLDRVAIAH